MKPDPAEAVHEAFRVDLEMIGDYRVAEPVGGMDWRAPARRLTPKSLACLHHSIAPPACRVSARSRCSSFWRDMAIGFAGAR